MLKIGFDAKRLFNNFTGLGNYSRTLLHDLNAFHNGNEYHLFTPNAKFNSRTAPFLNNKSFNIHYAHGFKPFWRTWSIVKDLVKADIEIFHGLSHEIPVRIKNSRIKTVVTIHDLIFKKYPDQYNKIDNLIYNFKFKYACKNSDRIIAISESTKKDIIDFYQIPEEKISVIYQSCDPIFYNYDHSKQSDIIKKYNLPNEYLLNVGTIIERKNLLNIVKAMELVKDCPPLAVIGKGKEYKNRVIKYINEKGLAGKVIFLDNVDFCDFPAIYSGAQAMIFPSIYEGFGIPVVEALFCKTPVITSNISSLPEAAGQDSLLVNPFDVESIADSISKVLTDSNLRNKMIVKGYEFVQKFNAKKVTADVFDLYQQLKNHV